ncbi:hypothetical protein NBRC3278_3155 [Acetobacter pasteurianus NBRC 3278]|uniref:Uncharacterized protein n=1 Tax=Acetobacter pasteurianus NBRC 3278 TaxID=1226660 RepID=A0A401X823_ACEPA|nr:hypothetical protein NBRC3278_3155 [Acetobacter pasteurianus NBRC 3278]
MSISTKVARPRLGARHLLAALPLRDAERTHPDRGAPDNAEDHEPKLKQAERKEATRQETQGHADHDKNDLTLRP